MLDPKDMPRWMRATMGVALEDAPAEEIEEEITEEVTDDEEEEEYGLVLAGDDDEDEADAGDGDGRPKEKKKKTVTRTVKRVVEKSEEERAAIAAIGIPSPRMSSRLWTRWR